MLTNVDETAEHLIDPTSEEITNIDVDLDEQCLWYKNVTNTDDDNDISQLNITKLASWILVGDQNDSVKYCSTFCSSKLVDNIETLEKLLSKFSVEEIDSARKRCNPLEDLGRLFFVNRSAVKCANLDALINLTNPSDENYVHVISSPPDGILFMADIDGPGCGFVDYILWRTGWTTKVFACVENNVRIGRFATIPESLETYKSHILSLSAVSTFSKFIHQSVKGGVHLVTCDGCPHNLTVNEYGKELRVKPFLVLYTIYALSLLRENGTFILKLFEIFTPFTVGLIYLIHKCFNEISIIKPAYSRPSNSERYLICKFKKSNTQIIQEHLSNIYDAMTTKNQSDIQQLVPIDVLKEDHEFFEYIFERNNSIVKKQLVAMDILKKYLDNENLMCTTKDEYRLKCLQLWNLPESFEQPAVIDAGIYCNRLLNLDDNDNNTSTELNIVDHLLTTSTDLENIFVDLDNWYFVPISITNNNTVRTFFLSQGSNNVYMYGINNEWTIVSDAINITLPARTIVYAELTTDMFSSANEYKESNGFHIIDGLFLGGTDIRKMKLLERHKLCQYFAKSINCRTNHLIQQKNSSYSRFRKAEKYCKPMRPIYDLIDFVNERNRNWRYCGENDKKKIVHYIPHTTGPQKYYRLNGILFFNTNIFDPSGICAPILWNWHLNNNLFNTLNNPFSFVGKRTDNVYLAHFTKFMETKCNNTM